MKTSYTKADPIILSPEQAAQKSVEFLLARDPLRHETLSGNPRTYTLEAEFKDIRKPFITLTLKMVSTPGQGKSSGPFYRDIVFPSFEMERYVDAVINEVELEGVFNESFADQTRDKASYILAMLTPDYSPKDNDPDKKPPSPLIRYALPPAKPDKVVENTIRSTLRLLFSSDKCRADPHRRYALTCHFQPFASLPDTSAESSDVRIRVQLHAKAESPDYEKTDSFVCMLSELPGYIDSAIEHTSHLTLANDFAANLRMSHKALCAKKNDALPIADKSKTAPAAKNVCAVALEGNVVKPPALDLSRQASDAERQYIVDPFVQLSRLLSREGCLVVSLQLTPCANQCDANLVVAMKKDGKPETQTIRFEKILTPSAQVRGRPRMHTETLDRLVNILGQHPGGTLFTRASLEARLNDPSIGGARFSGRR